MTYLTHTQLGTPHTQSTINLPKTEQVSGKTSHLSQTSVPHTPRLRGTHSDLKLPAQTTARNSSAEQRALAVVPNRPILRPDRPGNFNVDVTHGSTYRDFDFAVDGIYGLEITVNTEPTAEISYTLRSRQFDPYWGGYDWSERGTVEPGKPLDTTKLLLPGYLYTLSLRFDDDHNDYQISGDVSLKQFSAQEAARFSIPPYGTNQDHVGGSSSSNIYTSVPIKVGSSYQDQNIQLHRGGGCFTIYPCEGQENVRVSTSLEDRLIAKYDHVFFSSTINPNDPIYSNNLSPINYPEKYADNDKEYIASIMYTDDHSFDGTYSPESTIVREWYSDYQLKAGEPNVVCVAAPWALDLGASPSEGEQTLFPFSVTSLDGNQNCDLANAFNWKGLEPVYASDKKSLNKGQIAGIASGSALGALGLAALYCFRKKLCASSTRTVQPPTTPVASPSATGNRTIVTDGLTIDFSTHPNVTDAELAKVLHGKNNLTSIKLNGCSKLTDVSLELIKKQKELAELDLSGCTSLSNEKYIELIAELPKLRNSHPPTAV